MMIIKKWEKILDFNLSNKIGVETLNKKFTNLELELIDCVSGALLLNQGFYQDIVNARCLRIIKEDREDGILECTDDGMEELHDEYCNIVYDLGMIPIEVSIFKALDDIAIESALSLEDIEDNKKYLIDGIIDIYKKYQDTDEMSISFDIEKLISPIASK